MLSDEISKKRGVLFNNYNGFDAFDCTTMEQLELVEELLNSASTIDPFEILDAYTPRDTKHYSADKKSYEDHLQKAFELFERYNPNAGLPLLRQNFKEIMYVGLSKPMTKKEAKGAFLEHHILPKLKDTGLNDATAKKLMNAIIEYYYSS